MTYGYRKKLPFSYKEAVQKTKDALTQDGFGILSEIDVKETLKKKLGMEYDNYVILGACNPPLAHKALQAEREIGLLLPCNLIVYSEENSTYVSAILPSVAMGMVENPDLAAIAEEVEAKLKRVVDSL